MFYPVIVGGLALFAYLAWFAFNSLRHPKPRVVLSDTGVVVDGFAARFSARWDAFSGYAVQGQSTYVLAMKDAQAFVARQTARALAARFGSPFVIEMAMLDTDPEAVQRVLASRLPVVRRKG